MKYIHITINISKVTTLQGLDRRKLSKTHEYDDCFSVGHTTQTQARTAGFRQVSQLKYKELQLCCTTRARLHATSITGETIVIRTRRLTQKTRIPVCLHTVFGSYNYLFPRKILSIYYMPGTRFAVRSHLQYTVGKTTLLVLDTIHGSQTGYVLIVH